MLKSLRYRLLLWFVLSTILLSVTSFLLFRFHKSAKSNQQLTLETLQYLRHQFQKDQTLVANFQAADPTNDQFYMTGESDYLLGHYKTAANIDSSLVHYASHLPKDDADLAKFSDIRLAYSNYCMLLDSLVYKIYQRGYEFYGLEGELASYIYNLENKFEIRSGELLQLKVAEKEYIIHQDPQYIERVERLCNNLITHALLAENYTPQEKKILVETLKSYKKTFYKIVALDNEIGTHTNSGLQQELSELGFMLENLAESLISEEQISYQANMRKINLFFALAIFLLIALSFTMSVYTSRYLVKHLEQLSLYIHSLAKTNFAQRADFDLRHSTSEIRDIYLAFRNMLADLRVRDQQRNQALRMAEDTQMRYRDLADLLPQCVYETDRMGNLTYVNKAWFKVFGYEEADIDHGINLIEILNADTNSSLFGFSKVENNDFIATRKDGSRFPATVFSDVIRKGVRVIGRRGIIIDTSLKQQYIDSLKKETARAVTSDRHKSSFLANMSHEIRTPMNSIIGFTNMLSSKEISDEMKENFIGHIQTSSEMLLHLIDDIIDIAKIEDGQLKIKKTNCHPASLIQSLQASFEAYKNKIEKENLSIQLVLPNEPIHFRTDEIRLKQILSNLISNAIKFTEEGGIEIGMLVKNQRYIEFYVEDTGIGMNKDDLRTIFDRFKRTALSEEKKISGTGLGLAIAKNLVELLGGTMWVHSEPGKGTRFTFDLPYIRVAEDITIQPVAVQTVNTNWAGKKILVAEDDDFSFEFMAQLLFTTGAQVLRAHNGREAIEALQFHSDIDLVLMDLRMPELNGLEATREIKKTYPQLPVIAQTAFAMEGDRNRCIEAGCDDYITKPIHAENLLAKISQFIQNKPQPTQSFDETGKAKHDIQLLPSQAKNPSLN
ncbi:MAG: response regulator [Bacteroidota bacterium]|nr:MAG: response regulator [Bacteroidota bacterium]